MQPISFTLRGAILILAFALAPQGLRAQTDHPFTNGLGSSVFPYLIENVNDLLKLASIVNEGNTTFNNKNTYYRLDANINLSSYGAGYNNGKGWIPIGHSDEHAFMANFDGNNKTISNLFINHPSSGADRYDNSGLFGWLRGGSVKNLNVTGATITGFTNVGGIAGYVAFNSEINRIGAIENCCFSGTITGTSDNVGGIAGGNYDGRIINCWATGSVTGKNDVAGIAGYTYAGNITNCAALNQSVAATGAGSNVARIACAASGFAATVLSGNVAFNGMTITSGGNPKFTLNMATGVDGASRSGLDLRYASGFPAVFNTAPWVFTDGKLPGLGAAVAKPQYLTAILVSLTVNRDGNAWNYHEKTFTLKLSANEAITFPMTGRGTTMEAAVDQIGTWRIYDGNSNTGVTITTNNVSGSETLNYFTVSYAVQNTGTARGSAISATYGGSAITSGVAVLGGKQLIITTVGAGASTYAYTWSGEGTDNQTTPSITIPLVQSRINAVCTISSTHAVSFNMTGGSGTLAATVDGATITSGALVPYAKTVIFTANSNAGYRIKEWKDNGYTDSNDNANYTVYYLMEAHHVTVEFEQITYEVNFDKEGENGSLTAAIDNVGILSGNQAPHGSNIVFTAIPGPTYRVKEWKINGVVQSNKTTTLTLTYLTGTTNVTVSFEEAVHAVTFDVTNGKGTLTATVDGAPIYSGMEIRQGKEVVFTATPAEDQRIREWRQNGATANGTNENFTITNIGQPQTVTVAFEPINPETYAVTFSAGNNGNIAATVDNLTINSGDQVEETRDIVFTATVNTGFRVKEWKYNGTVVPNNKTNVFTLINLTGPAAATVEFERAAYVVTFNVVGSNGSLAATADGVNLLSGEEVSHGDDISFIATPSTGYRVKEWKCNGDVIPSNKTNMYILSGLIDAATVTVEFEQIANAITFNVTGGNGMLAAKVDGNAINTGAQVVWGKEVVFTASPNSGYRVKEWKLNNSVVPGNTTNSFTLTNMTAPNAVTVEYEGITYPVTFSVAAGSGTLKAKAGSTDIASGALVAYGSAVVFTAAPNPGYRVKGWSGDGTVSGNTCTISSLSAAAMITVEFERATYAVNFSVVNGNGSLKATVDGSEINNGVQVTHGNDVVFMATPSSGYRVKEWKLGNKVITGNTTNSYILDNLTAEATVSVEFTHITYAVAFSVTGGNGSIAATVGGSSIQTGAQVVQGSNLVFSATPNDGYQVKEWKVDGETQVGQTFNGFTLSGLGSGVTVTVEFVRKVYAVTFNVVGGENGKLTATVDGGDILSGAQVQHGKNVVFTASPNEGYRVKTWSGSGTASGNSCTISNLTATATVTVEFEPATYAVNFSVAGGNGTLAAKVDGSAITTGTQVLHGKTIEFMATPNDCNGVNEWKNGANTVNGTNVTYTITVTAARNITVAFDTKPCIPVTFSVVDSNYGSIVATVDGNVITSGTAAPQGSEVIFVATPVAGYRVKEWKLNDGTPMSPNTTIYTLTNLTATANVTVEFENVPPSDYSVLFSVVNGVGGTLTTTEYSASPAQVPVNGQITFTATPANGYSIKEWKDNGTTVNGKNTDYTINNIAATHQVTVEFELNQYTVTFSAGVGGYVAATVDGVNITSGTLVSHGKTVVLTANPVTGYYVSGWSGSGTLSDNTYTLTNLNSAANVTVSFTLEIYPLIFSVVGGANSNGTLSAQIEGGNGVNTGGSVEHGKAVVFTATSAAGYRVKEWKDNNELLNGNNATYRINSVTMAHNVTVEFEPTPPVTYAVTFSVVGGVNGNGTLAAAVDGAIISGAQVQQGNDVVFVATPNTGYRVSAWRLNNNVISGNTTNSYTLTGLSAAANVTVEFEPATYIVAFSVVGANGTLTATVDGTSTNGLSVPYDKNIILTATPASGYRVKEWLHDGDRVNGSNLSYTISNVRRNHTVTVEFEPITYTITFSVTSGNGSIAATVGGSGISSGALARQGSNVVFTANPNAGYRVKAWRLNGSVLTDVTSVTYTLTNLNAAATVTVEFERTTYPVTFSAGVNGSIAATVDGVDITSIAQVEHGKNVVFSAVPATNYQVKAWRLNNNVISGNISATYTLDNLTAVATVTVEFEPITYKVTYGVVSGNGTLSATVNGATYTSGANLQRGNDIVFTAIPNPGYRVKEWTNNNTAVNNANLNYTILNIRREYTVTVEFELIPPSYVLTFSVHSGNGTLGAAIGEANIASGSLVEKGQNIVFTASPNNGFWVKEWRLNGVAVPDNTTHQFTLAVTAVATVTVEFERAPNSTVIFSVENGNGTVSATVNGVGISSGGQLQQGSNIEFTASPANGYRVKEWKLNGEAVAGSTRNYTLENLKVATSTVTVSFEFAAYEVLFSVVGGNGTLTATSGGTNVNAPLLQDAEVVFTAIPNSGYRVKEWKDNNATVNGVGETYTIRNIRAEHIVTVEFDPVTIPVAFSVLNGNGTMDAKVDGVVITSVAQVQRGTNVVFTANPNIGYRVKEWNLNGTVVTGNKTNTFELTNLKEPATVTVEYESESFTITFMVVNGNGTLTAMVSGIVSITSGVTIPYGRSIIFTANSDYGYRVKEWKVNNGVIDNTTNSHTLTLTTTTTVIVEFEMMAPTITTSSLPNGAVGVLYSQILSVTSNEPVTWDIVNGSLPDGLSLSDDGRILGIPTCAGTFTFTVVAANSKGSDTKQLTCTIEKGVGEKVDVPTIQGQTLTSITVNAVPLPGNGQTVEYAIGTTNNANAASLKWQDEVIFAGLAENATYYLYARSKENDDYFAGATSVSDPITTNTDTGSEEISHTPVAKIYPNPTTGAFTLEFDVANTYHITITDMNGKILVRQTVTDQINRMNIRDVAAGVYLLIIDDSKKQTVMRIVKE